MTRQNGVLELERCAARAAEVIGFDGGVANQQIKLRPIASRAGDIDDVVEVHIHRDGVARIERQVLSAGVSHRPHSCDDGRLRIDLEAGVVTDGRGRQVGRVASRILDAAGASSQRVGRNADAIGVVRFATADSVGKGQGVGARARGVFGVHGDAAHIQGELGAKLAGACDIDHFAELHGGRDHIARVEPGIGRTCGAERDGTHSSSGGVYGISGVVSHGCADEVCAVASGVLDSAAIEAEGVGGQADAIGIGLPDQDGVVELEHTRR